MRRLLIVFCLCTAAILLLQIAGLGPLQATAAAMAVVLLATAVALWAED